jgi:molybdate transport system regulatory protein
VTDPAGKDTRLRVVLDGRVMIGPGKADLLEAIRDTGSIAAAGRSMGMSYKRAWTLVETMNQAFRDPVVVTSRGGRGGAALTETGERVLAGYRRMVALSDAAIAGEVAGLVALLRDDG